MTRAAPSHPEAEGPTSAKVRDRLFGDLATELLSLEPVLNDLAHDVAAAWH